MAGIFTSARLLILLLLVWFVPEINAFDTRPHLDEHSLSGDAGRRKSDISPCFESGECVVDAHPVNISQESGWLTGMVVGHVRQTQWTDGLIWNGGELRIESPTSKKY